MMKSLLAGISILALSTTSAVALSGSPADVNATPADGISVLLPLANELDTASSNVSATFEFEISISGGGAFPAGDNIDVVLDLPAGVTFSNEIGSTNPANANMIENGTGGAITGASLTAGGDPGVDGGSDQMLGAGAPGTGDVRLLVSFDPNAAVTLRQTIGFRVDLDVTAACEAKDTDTIDLGVLAFTEFGTPIDGGTTSLSIIQCTDAYVVDNITSDEATDDTFVTLDSDYNLFDSFDPLGAKINGDPGVATTTVGTFAITENPAAVIAVGGFNTNATTTFDSAQDVNFVSYAVNFGESTNGMSSAVVGGATSFGNSGTSFLGSMTPAQAAVGGSVTLNVDVGNLVRIDSQDVDLELTAVYQNNRAIFVSTESGDDFCGDGDLDAIEREGRVFGFFDWVSETGPVNTIFRVTGLDATDDTPYTVDFVNSRSGANGSFDGVILAADVLGDGVTGEVPLRSRIELAAVNPGFDRADVRITFESNADIDVDRLQSTNGILSNFGDGSNESFVGLDGQPTNDSDQTNGTE